jgi:hypothetical protein
MLISRHLDRLCISVRPQSKKAIIINYVAAGHVTACFFRLAQHLICSPHTRNGLPIDSTNGGVRGEKSIYIFILGNEAVGRRQYYLFARSGGIDPDYRDCLALRGILRAG